LVVLIRVKVLAGFGLVVVFVLRHPIVFIGWSESESKTFVFDWAINTSALGHELVGLNF
jgi:hypothetical protein